MQLTILTLLASSCAATTPATATIEDKFCYLPFDILFLQDTTESFQDDLVVVKAGIRGMIETILSSHPFSRFGVAEFRDKPFAPLGYSKDFCYKLKGHGLTDVVEDVVKNFEGLYASGGFDPKEAAYHGLINAVKDKEVGWRPLQETIEEDSIGTTEDHFIGEREDPSLGEIAGARLIIITTDAEPHTPGDSKVYNITEYPEMDRNFADFQTDTTLSFIEQCETMDYPSPIQVRDTLRDSNTHLVILTTEAAERAWRWVNKDLLEQPSDFLGVITSNSSNFIMQVLEKLEKVTRFICSTSTSSTSTSTKPVITTETRRSHGYFETINAFEATTKFHSESTPSRNTFTSHYTTKTDETAPVTSTIAMTTEISKQTSFKAATERPSTMSTSHFQHVNPLAIETSEVRNCQSQVRNCQSQVRNCQSQVRDCQSCQCPEVVIEVADKPAHMHIEFAY